MRTRSILRPVSAIAVLVAVFCYSAGAQGVLIPRCGNGGECIPVPCRTDAPCARPLPWNAAVTRSASHVTATLGDGVLHYEVDETFVNHGGRIGEADYIFPLPHNAAFSDLKLSINGELVSGETMDAQHARSIYEEIVRRQRDPALVEWMGYGMLRTRIFPILPGESKHVVVRFDQVAEREGDALRVDYVMGGPLGHGPIIRNIRMDDSDDSAASSFTLRYPAKSNYGRPYSPTHELRFDSRDGMNAVTARGDAPALTLLVPTAPAGGKPSITLLANGDGHQDGFALINVVPPTVSADVTPRDITFVLDVSGSMAGSKMEQARAAGRQLLSSLSARDRFRLIDFSTDVRSFRDGFTQATPTNIRAALSYLASLSAQGSTNISGALAEALRRGDDEHGDRLQVVLFLTDGQPTIGETSADAIAAEAERLRGSARVFTFGLGGDVNASLLEQLALQGRGTAQFVRPSEDVERAVALVSQRLTNPIATNVRVSADGVRLSRILPDSPIDIFAGQNIVILARYTGDGSATLRFDGDSPRGPVHWTQRVTFPREQRDNQFIGRLWATQRIGYLSAERRRVGANQELDNEIRSLGEQFGIPTEFTSYLVQEHGSSPALVAFRGQASMAGTLNQVVVTGATAAAPSAFEGARKATAQRAATTLAAADAATGTATGAAVDGATRHVGDHSFVFANGIWGDTHAPAMQQDSSVTRLRVQAFSAAYFRVLDIVPSIKPMLALGDHVIVAGRGIVLEVGPDGETDLGAHDIAALRAGW
jgi:Ca-activated chloride channel homolog